MDFVTYRITELEVKGLRLLSEPAVWEPSALDSASTFAWKPFSLENMYQVWDAPEFPLAVAISVQPRIDQHVEVSETLVLSRSYNFWAWALNFSQGTEWSNQIKERDGAMELAWELSRKVGAHWSFGMELRDHSDLPEYRRIAANMVSLGPVIRCQHDNWWLAFSLMPRILNFDFIANSDTPRDITFDTNQKLSSRIMFGLCY